MNFSVASLVFSLPDSYLCAPLYQPFELLSVYLRVDSFHLVLLITENADVYIRLILPHNYRRNSTLREELVIYFLGRNLHPGDLEWNYDVLS
jgi:hypothetical protein